MKKLEFQTKLSVRVRKLRLERSLTQELLAKKSDISRTSIVGIENNQFMPTLYIAYKIAKVLKITLDELIGE